MLKSKLIAALFLALAGFGLQGAEIPAGQLPAINDFAIVDNAGEQYIAATRQGLYHSVDRGSSWRAHKTGFGLPATMVETTPDGAVYAFVVTLGLLELDGKTNQWKAINNRFGSQVLQQLSSNTRNPSRLVARNHFGQLIVSENRGKDWHKLRGPYRARTEAEKRGQHTYVEKCQSCHGVDGVGETYTRQALTDKDYIMAPALDESAHAWHHTDEQLAQTIVEGSPRTARMPAGKNSGISAADAQDLVAYIKSLWTQRELDCQGPKHMECM
ncbi:MAG: cytochrome c [Gammaproteobacteria bacterium]|nr:cytochrome c [Gammaproteobacteria bacterium]MDH3537919.1 cytochrome c [Gammaproteobacteria bacterium]